MMNEVRLLSAIVCSGLLACSTFGEDGSRSDAGAGDAGTSDAAVDAALAGPEQVIAMGEKSPHTIAIDGAAVYWQNDGELGDGPGRVAGEIVRFERATAARRTLVAGIGDATSLVTDATTAFWLESEAGRNGTVGRVEKDGRGRQALLRYLYSYRAFAVDVTHLFYLDAFGALFRVDKDGASGVALEGKANDARALFVDEAGVYVGGATGITRADKNVPNGAVLFAASAGAVTAITGDDANVYWVSEAGGLVASASRASPGAPPKAIASGQKSPVAIAVAGGTVYWTNRGDGTVMQAPAGGAPSVLASGQKDPAGVAADVNGVFWTNRGDGTVRAIKRR